MTGPAVPALEARGLVKAYSGTRVLHGIDLTLHRGEVHVLLGENGAGKSTLTRILTGAETADAGSVLVDGVERPLGSPARALAHGIFAVYQELSLVPHLSALENVNLVRPPGRVVLARAVARERARDAFERLGVHVPLDRPVARLSIAQQQLVEIARALAANARILMLDEPTSSLGVADTEHLFAALRRLRDDGVALVYISHRLQEIPLIGDRITVLRDGRTVATLADPRTDRRELIRLMVDREVDERHARTPQTPGEELLRVHGLSGPGVREVDLTVRAGEVVGLAGLVGAGRSELAALLAGVARPTAGEIVVAGRRLRRGGVRGAARAGITLVPEDRKQHGLVGVLSIAENLLLPAAATGAGASARPAAARRRADEAIERYDVRCRGPRQQVRRLSGGNQQKVVLAKWLALSPRVVVLDEPTRGIDVGARSEIYRMIDEMAARGVGVLVISSDLSELQGLADRIHVMRAGTIVASLPQSASQAQILAHATTGAEVEKE